MKLFLREHVLLVLVQGVQFMLVVAVFWLAGFRDLRLALYSGFLGLLFLLGYLVYQYVSRRHFYSWLSYPPYDLEDALQAPGSPPVDQALHKLLKAYYRLYQTEIVTQSKRQEEQLIFMDLWVHQMKTPLSVIDLMARDLDEPHSSNIRDENDKLKTGLQTVLYMSRLRGIAQDFHIKQISLASLLQQVNADNKRLYIRNRVYPQVEMKEADIVVESDEKWLFFMVTQLVHNAVKYSVDKSNQVLLSVFLREGVPVLEIKDFGIGIPKEDQRRIYDAFFTGSNGQAYKESTGVGLYVANEVADYLGHTLEMESEVGGGTAFRIVFNK